MGEIWTLKLIEGNKEERVTTPISKCFLIFFKRKSSELCGSIVRRFQYNLENRRQFCCLQEVFVLLCVC